MSELTGLYRINDYYVMVLTSDGRETEFSVGLYEECDYRPSLRFLLSAKEYEDKHGPL